MINNLIKPDLYAIYVHACSKPSNCLINKERKGWILNNLFWKVEKEEFKILFCLR